MSRLGLLGLFALALWLRLWGLAQGYPDFYGHVDEIGVAASIWNFFRATVNRNWLINVGYPAMQKCCNFLVTQEKTKNTVNRT